MPSAAASFAMRSFTVSPVTAHPPSRFFRYLVAGGTATDDMPRKPHKYRFDHLFSRLDEYPLDKNCGVEVHTSADSYDLYALLLS
jgi:hypothetical protein